MSRRRGPARWAWRMRGGSLLLAVLTAASGCATAQGAGAPMGTGTASGTATANSGTAPPATSAQSPSKLVFILHLVGFCAGVDQRLASAGKNPPPAMVAHELEALVGYASSGPVPTQDRPQYDRMVTAISAAADQQRIRDTAQQSGDQARIQQAGTAATQAMHTATAEAMNYGMPDLSTCPTVLKQQTGADWTALTQAPAPAQQAAVAAVNGIIWVVGGLTAGQATTTLLGYDPAIGTWTTGPSLPTPLHHAMAVAYQGHLVVIGGFVPAGGQLTGQTSDRVYRLDGTQWVLLPSLHHARAAGAAVVVNGAIVVVGGRDSRALVPSTEIFDGTSWHDGAALQVPGDHLAAVSLGGAVYAVGGRNLSPDKNSAALQRYDVSADRWVRLPDMSAPRGGLGAAVLGGKIIAVGGEEPTGVDGTVESYDPATSSWLLLPALPTPRHGMAVTAVADHLYAIGGSTTPGHEGSTPTVEALGMSAPSTSPSTSLEGSPSPAASTGCPTSAQAVVWSCLTAATVTGSGGVAITYTTSFTPSPIEDGAHYHLHLFTANASGSTTSPPDSIMRMAVAPHEGSWFNLYANGVPQLDAHTEKGGLMAPLDTQNFTLLCIRVADGTHNLARDRQGGFATGNCVSMARS